MITVIIQTYNEEKSIVDAIKSARLLTDTILVVDMNSTDKTRELAKHEGARVETIQHTNYVEPGRFRAVGYVETPWVFILDADERLTPELAQEIQDTITSTTLTHFSISRKNIFAHRTWLRFGGWWPDKQLRLFKKEALLEWPKRIHSSPTFSGPKGELIEPFIHLFHPTLSQMVEKTISYEKIEAQLHVEAHHTVNSVTVIRKFLGELFRRLFFKQGFRDGIDGCIESMYQAYSKSITWLLTYELQRKK